MTSGEQASRKPLRLWPGVVIVALQAFLWLILPVLVPEAGFVSFLGGTLGGGLAILIWWLFFSRAPWLERLGVTALMVAAVVAARPILHESIKGAGMGMMFYFYVIPVLCFALVAWAIIARRLVGWSRFVTVAGVVALACGSFAILRTDGIRGSGGSDLRWRWTPTAEERLLASEGGVRETPSGQAAATETGVEWPGFRGANRDSVVRGVRLETDWASSPPVELWSRPVGPGWSSFAVRGDFFYTQEQNGEHEVVSCYRVSTGEPVWKHRDDTRFYESNAGAGPRGTPTLANGRVYTFGATGIVNALDAGDGAVVWTRNAAADTGAKTPGWGFSSSPLVEAGAVIVAASGSLVAYDPATGEPRWLGPKGTLSYSSPHSLMLGDIPQVVLLTGKGAVSVAPESGTLLWEHKGPEGVRIVQPALTAEGDLLIHDAGFTGDGMRRVAASHGDGGWTFQERWSTRGLKPYYNDFVVHNGHVYGFDGAILSCIDVADGSRKWKGGRFGNGQLLLLADQDLLLVLSEEGDLALVAAKPDQFTEVARFKAIEGKTWNHPALVGDILLTRNDHEMAAFRLATADR